jgi:hypothetical protein
MFSMVTNIYNNKNQGTHLDGIVHSHRKTDFIIIIIIIIIIIYN